MNDLRTWILFLPCYLPTSNFQRVFIWNKWKCPRNTLLILKTSNQPVFMSAPKLRRTFINWWSPLPITSFSIQVIFFFFCLFFKPSLDSENCLFFTCKTNLGYISYHFSTEKHYLVWPTWVEQKHCLRMLVGIIFSHLVLLQFTDLSFIQNYKIWYKEIVGMIFFQDFIN